MQINFRSTSLVLGTLMMFFSLSDPLDKLFGMKVPSFILFFITATAYIITKNKRNKIPSELVNFLFLFSILIPILSTFFSIIINTGETDFNYIKAYIFLLLTIIFYYTKELNFLNIFIVLLNILALLNLVIFLIIIFNPNTIPILYLFGETYTIFSMPTKYIGSFNYDAIYFHITPLFVVLLGYNLYKYFTNPKQKYLILLLINISALFICGSRNNIFSTVLMLFTFYFVFVKKKGIGYLLMISLIMILFWNLPDILEIFNETKQDSDATKYEFAYEYFKLFSDPHILYLGQGIGSYFQTSSRGLVSITELTYFEIFRRLGLFLGSLQIILMFYPLSFWNKIQFDQRWIILSYTFYLIMSFFNPFYFNSSGMLLLSFVLVSKYNIPNTFIVVKDRNY